MRTLGWMAFVAFGFTASLAAHAGDFNGRWATTTAQFACDNGFVKACNVTFSIHSKPDMISIYDFGWDCTGNPVPAPATMVNTRGPLVMQNQYYSLKTGTDAAGAQIFVDWNGKQMGTYGFDYLTFTQQHYGPPTQDRIYSIKFQADGKADLTVAFEVHKINCRVEGVGLEPQFP